MIKLFHSIYFLVWQRSAMFLLVWFLLILALCSMPGDYIPSTDWLELLSFDKLVHTGLFFVLCFLGTVTLRKRALPIQWDVALIVAAILYGAALEYMQGHYFRHRSADWLDIAANTTGVLLAVVFRNRILAWCHHRAQT